MVVILNTWAFWAAPRQARERGWKVPALSSCGVYQRGHSAGRLLKYSLFMLHDPTLQALLDEAIEFPWQQTLLEALIEWHPDYLPGKISAAEHALAARSCEPTDLNEQIALEDALHTLRLLFSKEASGEKFTN
jgi:hypothetical protein